MTAFACQAWHDWKVRQQKSHSFILQQGINASANFGFLQRLSVIFGFGWDCLWFLASCRDYYPRKMSSCRDCPRSKITGTVSAGSYLPSTTGSKKSGQSPWKPNMTDSLCRKRKLADSFIPCDLIFSGLSSVWRHNKNISFKITLLSGCLYIQTSLYPL